MRIPSDIQVNVPAPRSGLLEALGLRVGQVVEVQVVGQVPGGGTMVKAGNQQFTLNLPPGTNPGDFLQLQLTAGGAKPQFALLTANGKPPPGAVPQQAGQSTAQQPAVTVTTSTTIPPPGTPSQGPNQAPPQIPQQTPQGAGQQPLPNPAPATPAPGALPSAQPATPAAQNLPSIPLPQAVQTELNLQPGQLVTARVAPPAPNGQPQIAIGNQTFPATLPGNPPPGTILQFQADASGTQPRLILQSQGEAHPRQIIPGSLKTLIQQGLNQPHNANTAVPQAASPQQAIAQTAATAVARQDSVGTLLLSLAGLRGQSGALPNTINTVAERLLGQQIDLSRGMPTAEALRNAVATSGVFLETGLVNSAATPQPQGDTKALLMLLRNMLGNWLGKPDGGLPMSDKRPPPPVKGSLPRAQMLQGGQLAQNASAEETARHLLHQTDSALSRVRLFQLSSLPDGGARANPAAMQEWNLELPMLLNGHLSMAQLQITRDPEEDADPAQRGWHMVFSIHFGRIGEVGARIAWRAKKTSIMLWAEEEETAAVLEENISELAESLEAAGLEPGSIRVRRGHPDSPPPKSGGFVDESS